MSLTAPGIKGVVTDFMDTTPSAAVAFQAVPARFTRSIAGHLHSNETEGKFNIN